jgi:hypothetical protein
MTLTQGRPVARKGICPAFTNMSHSVAGEGPVPECNPIMAFHPLLFADIPPGPLSGRSNLHEGVEFLLIYR